MYSKKSVKGQVFSIDLLIAIMLFGVVLLMFASNYGNLYEHETPWYERAVGTARRTALLLATTPGAPENWANSSFALPGFASEPFIVSEPLLEQFLQADDEAVFESFGAQGFRVFVNLSLQDRSVARAGGIPFSRIAYTRAGGSEGEAADNGFRHYLLSEGIPFTEYSANGNSQDFIELLSSIALYDTVVVEAARINSTQLDASQQAAFSDWVASGGNYVQKQEGTVIELLNATQSYASQGRVVIASGLLRNASYNDAVACTGSVAISNASVGQDFTYLVNASNGAALFASWPYGGGRVYFACDTQGTVTGSLPQTDLMAINNFFGLRAEKGDAPVNATVSVPYSLPVAYRSNNGVLEVIAWID
ncbi:hypothetical protein AUJ14_04175 [Candidatus Micrarchaeota archaeon CG1_02_55_22]|nr:MAG: hypothetical protein AUJ14_04175 [Candidatus Micrarchaeota archaeon CG1_02_55_22]